MNLAQIIYFCFKISNTEKKGSVSFTGERGSGVFVRFLLMFCRFFFLWLALYSDEHMKDKILPFLCQEIGTGL